MDRKRREENSLIASDEDEKNLETILAIRDSHKNCWTALLKRKSPELLAWIDSKVPLLQDEKYTYTTKLYWILHGLEDF